MDAHPQKVHAMATTSSTTPLTPQDRLKMLRMFSGCLVAAMGLVVACSLYLVTLMPHPTALSPLATVFLGLAVGAHFACEYTYRRLTPLRSGADALPFEAVRDSTILRLGIIDAVLIVGVGVSFAAGSGAASILLAAGIPSVALGLYHVFLSRRQLGRLEALLDADGGSSRLLETLDGQLTPAPSTAA